MSTTELPSQQPDLSAAEVDETVALTTVEKPGIRGFASLFSAAAAAAGKQNAQPWQQKGNNSRHEKKIGMAFNGSRKSMGKR